MFGTQLLICCSDICLFQILSGTLFQISQKRVVICFYIYWINILNLILPDIAKKFPQLFEPIFCTLQYATFLPGLEGKCVQYGWYVRFMFIKFHLLNENTCFLSVCIGFMFFWHFLTISTSNWNVALKYFVYLSLVKNGYIRYKFSSQYVFLLFSFFKCDFIHFKLLRRIV